MGKYHLRGLCKRSVSLIMFWSSGIALHSAGVGKREKPMLKVDESESSVSGRLKKNGEANKRPEVGRFDENELNSRRPDLLS